MEGPRPETKSDYRGGCNRSLSFYVRLELVETEIAVLAVRVRAVNSLTVELRHESASRHPVAQDDSTVNHGLA
jgi:hypothetical protein